MKNSQISTIIEVHVFDANNRNISFTTEDAEKALRTCAKRDNAQAHMYLVDSHESQERLAQVDIEKSIAAANDLPYGFDGIDVDDLILR